MAINIPYIAPPNLGGKDYSASLFNAASSLGNTIADQRKERTRAQEFQQEQERLKKQGQMDYAAAMARIEADKGAFGQYAGTSESNQDWNVINAGDTSDPRYPSSYFRLFQTKKPHYIQTATGEKVVWETVTPPDWVLPPGGGGVPPITYDQPAGTVPATGPDGATPAIAPAPAIPANPGGTTISEPQTIAGTEPRPTEATQRDQKLYSGMAAELPTLEDNWDALGADFLGMVATEAGTSAFLKSYVASPEYQQAYNSMMTIVGNYMWSVSGASAPEAEVARRVQVLLPTPNEGKESKRQKLARARQLVEAVRLSAETGQAHDIGDAADLSGGGGGETIDLGDDITMERY